ncbi:hypothetical protein OIU79_002345 [Salix purpurea]|uniref:Uncharacterized protein n=1 Tax=Salix purpurea TaxID=77065 RepID=A0A9Q0ZHW9_SALPP|nr:hypothetical protein OIU79_002345 [Salix purpurea]
MVENQSAFKYSGSGAAKSSDYQRGAGSKTRLVKTRWSNFVGSSYKADDTDLTHCIFFPFLPVNSTVKGKASFFSGGFDLCHEAAEIL